MATRVHLIRRRIAAAALTAVLLPATAACGPTADQLATREAASQTASAPAAAPPQQARIRTAEPEPSSPPEPMRVGVSGAQTGMAQEVQDACQWLLRQDRNPFPAADAGGCVAAAMVAGEGAQQSLTTTASWLPPGTYGMEFATSPEFAMELRSSDEELQITVGGGQRSLRTGEGAWVQADPDGSAEEAYAAVLVEAAELTSNPERLRSLIQTANPAAVEYDASYKEAPATRLTAVIEPGEPGDFTGTLVLVLDEMYRPALVEYVGKTRGISSSIRAEIAGWGGGSSVR